MTNKEGERVPLTYINPVLIEKVGALITDEIKEEIVKKGSIQHIKSIPDDIKKNFCDSCRYFT